MRKNHTFTVVLLGAFCGLLGLGCGSSGDATYVVVTVERGAGTPPSGLDEIVLSLSLGGKMENAVIKKSGGKPITLPTDFALEIRSGVGSLLVDASARMGGQDVGGGNVSAEVKRGAATRVTVRLDFPRTITVAKDGGADPLVARDASSEFDSGGRVQDAPGGADALISDVNPLRADAPVPSFVGDTATAPDVAVADASVETFRAVVDAASGADAVASAVDAPVDAPVNTDSSVDGGLTARLSLNKTAHDFGMVLVGSNSGLVTFTITNLGTGASGALMAVLGGANPLEFGVVSDGCSGMSVSPNGSCVVTMRLQPKSAGAWTASFTVTGMPGGSVLAMLMGTAVTPGALSLNTGSPPFPALGIGKTADSVFTVTNTGGTETGPLVIAITGTDMSQFSLAPAMDACTGMKLLPMGICSVAVRFAPTTSGAKSASLTADATPGGTGSAALSGTGLLPAAFTLTPFPYDYGTVTVGMPATNTFTLKNTGDEPSGIPSVTVTGPDAAQFTIMPGANGCTQALAPLASCTVDLAFGPTSHNTKTAVLNASAAIGGSVMSALSGIGQDSVSLTVLKTGTGTGTVGSGEPVPMLACGATCVSAYMRATSDPIVTLTATPDVSSTFTGWMGCTTTAGTVCNVTLSAAKTVTATFAIKTFTLTVTRMEIGVSPSLVTLNVAMTPPVDCGATCMATYNYGTMVSLSPTPITNYFGGWAGDCSGFAGCSVAMTADHAVTVRFSPANKTFVTSNTYPVSFLKSKGGGGTEAQKLVSGADWACKAAAIGAGLTGTYVAWVARDGINANARLGTARGWVRGDGRPFADSIAMPDFPGQIYYPVVADELGTSGETWDVLTGAALDGSIAPLYSCSNWTVTDSSQSARTGARGTGSFAWSSYYQVACDQPMRVHCFGVDYVAKVTVPAAPAARKFVFVSNGGFVPSAAGLMGADNTCNVAAMNYGLPGTYKAMLATSTTTIASRFSTTGVPVVRPDGVWVSNTDTEFLSATPVLLAPIMAHANPNSYIRSGIWTGTNSPTALSPGDGYCCNNWTTNTASSAGINGANEFTGNANRWLSEGQPACTSGAMRLYCLQN